MNPVDALAKALKATRHGRSWKARCLFPERHNNRDRNPSMSIFESTNGGPMLKCQAGCSTSTELMKEARRKDLLPDRANTPVSRTPRVVAKYDYLDKRGDLLFQVVRKEPGADGKKKSFSQRRPDGKGGWIWNVPADLRTLYRLPEILSAKKKKRILVTEGEKDVNALRRLGFVGSCNPGGAGKWEPKYTKLLRGKRVIVFGDNDPAGQKHAHKVAADLYGKAASVRVMFAPAPYKDAAEWIEEGATPKNIRKLAKNAPQWTPALAKSQEPLVLDPKDPVPSARKFIARWFTKQGKRTLVFHQGDFRTWNGTYYPEVPGDQMRACAYRFLEKAMVESKNGSLKSFKPTASKVTNFIDALRSEAILSAETEAPTWRNGAANNSPPEEILSCQNGLLHLPTGDLQPHTPDFYNHNALDYAYDPNAPKPEKWLKFLKQLWPKDKQARKTLRDIIGYLLTADTRQQKIFLLL